MPHWEEPGAAEVSGGLPRPVLKWSPDGAKQEVSPQNMGIQTHADTHTCKASAWEKC